MDVGTQEVVPHGAAPKQLSFGATGTGQYNVASPKRASQRGAVSAPSDSPDMDHKQLVNQVHRLFEQDKADAEHFEQVKDQINDHAAWLKFLKVLIVDIQQKVTAVTVQAVENDV